MNDQNLERVRELVSEYINGCRFDSKPLKFDSKRIASIARIDNDGGDQASEGYRVAIVLACSQETIERFVTEGDPVEADVLRAFLTGDWHLTVIVKRGQVISEEWEGIEFLT